jgi:hypothetical protein
MSRQIHQPVHADQWTEFESRIPDFMRKPLRFLVVSIACAASVGFFFRYQFMYGFNLLNGDRYDGIIEISILEHWYHVFQGHSNWATTKYFFPAPHTLGYNDGYLLFGIVYSIFRTCGVDPFLSSELVNVVTRCVSFVGFYLLSRKMAGFSVLWALFASTLFTIANNLFLHARHAQLFSVCLAPVMGLLLHALVQEIVRGRSWFVICWGGAAAGLFGAWLLTAFYTAWFFVFFLVAVVVTYAFTSKPTHVRQIIRRSGQRLPALLGVAIMGIFAISPFLWLYLPKAQATGMHAYEVALTYTPTLLDTVSVGEGSLIWGPLVKLVDAGTFATTFSEAEGNTGMPPLLLVFFLAGVAALVLQHVNSRTAQPSVMLLIALATLATWALCIRVGSYSGWWAVYNLVPGGKAIRGVTRYQIFLVAPVVLVAVWQVSRLKWGGKMARIVVCVALVLEEVNTKPPLGVNRRLEVTRLEAIGVPPKNCQSFFVSNARDAALYGPAIDGRYSHNVEAMIVAETSNTPTINGFASFAPADWDLPMPFASDYRERVATYAKSHDLRGLCELNLQTLEWSNHVDDLAR